LPNAVTELHLGRTVSRARCASGTRTRRRVGSSSG
jgi:hypothetical protein